eukprot:CAMPEP_0115101798 /NCGR_PEP_ID=MMETSP0227-20121206/33466_1 /TAXON_ID=89957 /ORGANISM="Polarella glacialis, Strain CCMP 1383" /LENGTH=412 /DNA_ID=CAMNT_0002497657 /DNA_START=80 /DNA_END=1318 /DNA_ORIENTATION=+
MAQLQMWEIVGGADKGGIIVREGDSIKSTQVDDRLSTGALVQELELKGERLHYKRVTGSGPAEGWVSIKLTGKDLAVRTDKQAGAATSPNLPSAVGPQGEAPLPIALFFPGQGSQYVKMMSGVQDLPAVKEMLEKAKAILGYDILDICLNGPEEKLEETRYCQPALFIGGLAGLEKLRNERPEAVTRASVMAGLSLGEYTALCAAGVMSFEDGLKLVKLRGEAMQEAAALSKQLMLSVAGLEKDKLEPLCKEALKSEEGGVCSIANSLFPGGFAVGGTEKAIHTLKDLAEKNGALQAKVLKTAGAFHTSLMQPAQDKLAAALEETLPNMKSPKHTVWMNASAEPMRPGCEPSEIVALLKRQLTNPVLWEASVKAIIKEGVTEFYEVGPMKQIKAMMKRIDPAAWKVTTNVEV